jgi:hypothetical protein
VTDAAPLAAYIASMARYADAKSRLENLELWLEDELARRGGVISITIDAGIFIAGPS